MVVRPPVYRLKMVSCYFFVWTGLYASIICICFVSLSGGYTPTLRLLLRMNAASSTNCLCFLSSYALGLLWHTIVLSWLMLFFFYYFIGEIWGEGCYWVYTTSVQNPWYLIIGFDSNGCEYWSSLEAAWFNCDCFPWPNISGPYYPIVVLQFFVLFTWILLDGLSTRDT